jgi:ferric-dicitrate binding protein FerR (iron transport regulator)
MHHTSRPARHRFRPWTASILLPFALLTTAAAQTSATTVATITALEGLAEVVLPGATRPVPVRLDTRVAAGSTVRTKANGRLELQFDDRSILRLDKNTEIKLLGEQEERGVLVTLGNIWARIQSTLGMSKFKIKTPSVVAGVRGTIVRAEVTEEDESIAVDEGEVEVTTPEGDTPVILKRNQVLRGRRGGRRFDPQSFDPQAREKWEFWTDPLVQQRIQAIQEAAAEVKRTSEEVHEQARSTFQALAVSGVSVQRIGKRVGTANGLVDSVAIALKQPPPPPRRPGRRPGGPPPPGPPPKQELLARLDRADRTYAETLPLISRGRDAIHESVKDVADLREALAEQQKASEDLKATLERFRTRREHDPHWPMFRPHVEECQGHHRRIGEALQGAQPLLSRQVPEKLGDDPQAMPSIEIRLQWGRKTLDALENQIGQRREQIKALRAALTR